SDTIWVKFPVQSMTFHRDLTGADQHAIALNAQAGPVPAEHQMFVVIWTTTPWTIPGNRAVAYSPRIAYGLYEVTAAENDFGPRPGEKLIFAEALAEDAFTKAKLEFRKLRTVTAEELGSLTLA